MKKISAWKKIGLAVAAAALVASFIGCANPATGAGDGTTTTTTDGTTGGTTTDDTTKTPEAEDKKNYAEIPAGAIVLADFTRDSKAPANVTLPGWGYVGSFSSDSTYSYYLDLNLASDKVNADYCSLSIKPSTKLDVTGKTLCVIYQGAKSDDILFRAYSDCTAKQHSSEIRIIQEEKSGWNSYEASLDGMWAAWDNSSSAIGEPADLTAVEEFKIAFEKDPQKNIKIAAIYLK